MAKIIFNESRSLADIISTVKGTSGASLDSVVEMKPLKKSRETKIPFDKAFKGPIFCTKHEFVFIGANYENAVNNQLVREGKEDDFVSQPLPWGEWVGDTMKVIHHNDNFYLRYYTDMSANSASSERIYHYADGKLLTSEEIDLLFAEYMSPVSEDSGRQETDKAVKPKNVKMDGIMKVKFGGNEYVRKGFEV